MDSYRKRHGDRLTHPEAADLLIRAAQGHRLFHVPIKYRDGYRLQHVVTLTATQLQEHDRLVSHVAQVLELQLFSISA